MKTQRLYQNDVYLSKCQSKIVEVQPVADDKNKFLLILDNTIFFPTGGGQSCDLGMINNYSVTDVFEKDDEIYHKIEVPSDEIIPSPGMQANLSIDWRRRFDNMQRHCGEHILSGVFYRLYGGVNRGFHMGEDYLTIDINLEDMPEFTELNMEMCLKTEEEANKVIWQDLPVKRHHFNTKEEAKNMPVRKALTIESDISIVTIGDDKDPADSVACCGTHPSTAGQVGMIKIYKVEPNKGMFRVFFEAGERALKAYDSHYELLARLGNDLSTGMPELWDKYLSRQDKNREIRDRLYHLTREVIRRESQDIENLLSTDNPDKMNFIREYELISIDDVIDIGRSLSGKIPGMLYLIYKPDLTVLLHSDKYDCGKLVKENAAVFNGKGGGNKAFARAIFQRRDDLNAFIKSIEMITR